MPKRIQNSNSNIDRTTTRNISIVTRILKRETTWSHYFGDLSATIFPVKLNVFLL